MKIRNLLIVIAVYLVVMLTFFFLRFQVSRALPTYDSYEHVLTINSERTISYQLQESVSPLDIILGGNYGFWMRITPLLFGIFSLVLIYLITKSVGDALITSLIVAISPVFLYTHGVYNDMFLPLFFILLGAYLILRDKYLFSIISFLGAFISNPTSFFIILVLLLVFFERYKTRKITLPLLGLAAVGFMFIRMNINAFSFTSLFTIITDFVSDMGAIYGIGIFELLLAVIGIVLSWSEKKKYAIFYYTLVLLFVTSLYVHEMILFFYLNIVYFAALTVSKIWKYDWVSSTLKNYVLLLIACGLIFSSGSYINRITSAGPYNEEVTSLDWLSQRNPGKVLSHYRYGSFIESLSGNPVYIDRDYYLQSDTKAKINKANEIFQTRDLEELHQFISANDIDYIWINREMKQGEVWQTNDEGMLFLLRNSENFQRIYYYKGIEVWRHVH